MSLKFERQEKPEQEVINVKATAEVRTLLKEYAAHLNYPNTGKFISDLLEKSIREVATKDQSFMPSEHASNGRQRKPKAAAARA